ncbi:MAG TPA: alpha/beta hydrolase-fold protein [Chitinophagaceae bacterium]|nr:alpha/beta hydrolase-fold protein [Chitinophagaceae bacterium]
MRIPFIAIALLLCPALNAQDFKEYKNEIFKKGDHRLPYRILYPLNFDTAKKYPLLIFLHGAFEKGTDNQAQLNIGGRFFLADSNRRNFPAIVMFPQCPTNDSWAYFETEIDSATGLAKRWTFPFYKKGTAIASLLKQWLDSSIELPFVDKTKIYIGGLSQGGMGVYDLIARYPDIFAAAFPICGAGKISTASKFAQRTAVWIFHGTDDDIVPVYFSQQFYKKLKKLGADVRYTEYARVRHNSWLNAFKEPQLLSWLFSKAKK